MLMTPAAYAGFCASGAVCDIELTNTNIAGFSIDVRVTINNSGPTTVLTVLFISDNITNTPIGFDMFGYNSSAAASSLPANWAQASCGQAGCQMDGFGRFVSEIDKNPGADYPSFSFTLASLVTTFTDNANGGEFAGHIRYDGGCSGFFSDGTSNNVTTNTNCISNSPRPAPEPGSLMLLGIALIGLAFARRRNVERTLHK